MMETAIGRLRNPLARAGSDYAMPCVAARSNRSIATGRISRRGPPIASSARGLPWHPLQPTECSCDPRVAAARTDPQNPAC